MKHALLLVLAALLPIFASCGSSATSANMVGTYAIDTATLEAEMQKAIDEMPADQRAMAEGVMPMMIGVFAEAAFTLNDDDTFEIRMAPMGQESVTKGTWKLEGEEITFTTTEENGNPTNDVKVGKVSGGDISITEEGPDGNPMTLVLKKK